MKTKTEDQIKAFYRAIGKVMEQHDIEALAGVWFGCDDSHGQLLFYNVADTRMSAIVTSISEKWEVFLKEAKVEQGKQIGFVREISVPDDLNN